MLLLSGKLVKEPSVDETQKRYHLAHFKFKLRFSLRVHSLSLVKLSLFVKYMTCI